MRTHNYDNHIIVKCPKCGKVIENDNLEQGEVNGIHACKHLLFAQGNGGGNMDFLFYINRKFKTAFEPDTALTERELAILEKLNSNIEIHRYDSYDDKTFFVFCN